MISVDDDMSAAAPEAFIEDLAIRHLVRINGLRKKTDILGVIAETTIWQYTWYGKLSFQIYNDVDLAFYESINVARSGCGC